ncbi:nitrogen permease regulator 2, partial [Phenoliferia sp. Uapishka_3]
MTVSMREQLKNQSGSYLPRLVAVLYAVFDPREGPKIVCQVPEGSVATALSTFPAPEVPSAPPASSHGEASSSAGLVRSTSEQGLNSTQVLFDFSSILDFVIPKPELCGHLITKATRTSKILGFPIRISDETKYHKGKEVYNRNAFIFNLCFVFERDAELSGFEPIVRKIGRTLREQEKAVSLLSEPPPTFKIADMIEQLYMDINSFSETSIPLLETDLDLMLFPFRANPSPIRIWDVPIAVTGLEAMKNGSWDVTLFKVCTFIDGVNHVKRIAELAEVDLNLARLCIQHLLFYSAIILVDVFQYSNSYATLPGIAEIVQHGEEEDEGVTDLRAECEAYVYNGNGDVSPLPFATLLNLYAHLSPSLSIGDWMELHSVDSYPIDVRRMIQFGVIKGFLRRVHAFPIWLDHPSLSPPPENDRRPNNSGLYSRPDLERNTSSIYSSIDGSSLGNSTSSQIPTPLPQTPSDASLPPSGRNAPSIRHAPPVTPIPGTSPERLPYPPSLPQMLDGKHHTDAICIRFSMTYRYLQTVLMNLGGADADGIGTSAGEAVEGQRRGSSTPTNYGRVAMLFV